MTIWLAMPMEKNDARKIMVNEMERTQIE